MLLLGFQERPSDVVVEGFIHLQQYHLKEIYRGLGGDGEYRLRRGFPTCCSLPPPPTAFSVDPHMIVHTLQNPSAEVVSM